MKSASIVLRTNTLFHSRYWIIQCIKVGGMGAIYELRDQLTTGHRALKVMLPSFVEDANFRARFALEAQITGGIESDHIVRTMDVGVDDSTKLPFFVMELLRGEELSNLLQKRGFLPFEDVCLYLSQVARALDKTHAAGIIHRDLKPSNLFLTYRDDGSPCIKILDFGIARVISAHRLSMSRQMLGTPTYSAPEQIRAESNIGPGTDIHALGHVAYTLLVGEPYWAQESIEIPSPYLLAAEILRGIEESPTARALRRRRRALPAEFDQWFRKATALRPTDRFAQASVAMSTLAEVLSVGPPSVNTAGLPPPRPPAESLNDETVVSRPGRALDDTRQSKYQV